MKRSHLPSLLLLLITMLALKPAQAQTTYGNEWIDYSKTYYKFKVGKTGVFRIYRSALTGVPATVTGSNFILYRDGKEVPVYVSAESMGANDYIEFWGLKADGWLDKKVYLDPSHQPNDRISLFTDTAAYFLTYDNSNSHLRYVQAANAIPGTTPNPEPYWLATVGMYARNVPMKGPSYSGSPAADLYSPQFDAGEGFVESASGIGGAISTTLNAPNLVSGVNATLRTSVVARSFLNSHRVHLAVNSTALATEDFGVAEAKQFNVTVPASTLSGSNSIVFTATQQGSGVYDIYGISFAELEYPRNFNMSGQDYGVFQLPATGAAQYVEVTGMTNGRLYDITNRKWYAGNTAVGGKLRFYLDPSITMRQIVLMSDASVPSLTPVKNMQFFNYGQTAAEGDFVIITHKDLMAQVNGHNYVQDYATYRRSAAGGSRKVVVADVTDLYDQFGYGYDVHPISIKHFLKYAYDKWSTRPTDALLIGKGLYYRHMPAYYANRAKYSYPVVPTWGEPGSDMEFTVFTSDHLPKMRIGRIQVLRPQELSTYLTKVINSEQLYPPAPVPTVATELWKKRMMHVVGSSSQSTQDIYLLPPMNAAIPIVAGPYTGKQVTTLAKSANAAITVVNNRVADSLIRNGVSMITFFGHGSPTSFDYALPDPSTYSNNWRMGSFLGLGCDLSQMFDIVDPRTVTEQYLLAPNAGVTTFIASSNTSYTDLDAIYIHGYYHSMAHNNYGAPLGTHFNYTHDSIHHMYLSGAPFPSSWSTQLECLIFSGDPSITLPSPVKPDYHVADEGLSTNPGNVSASLDTFGLRIISYNLGKATTDTVDVKVEHIDPTGKLSLVGIYRIPHLAFSDTTTFKIPVDGAVDLGLNKYRVTIDASATHEEVSEANNVGNIEVFIFSDNLVPVYPKEFAIVHEPNITLKGSTLNPFRTTGRYLFEIDTTELFNSPAKQSTTITSKGGVIKWTPSMQYRDSVVYYWRTALDSVVAGKVQWTNSSFIYLAEGSDGWNQSHFYQYAKDASAGLLLYQNRTFNYTKIANKLEIRNTVLCNGINTCNADAVYMRDIWNGTRITQSSYNGVVNALQVIVVDTATGRIKTNAGYYGSTMPGFPAAFSYNFQFDISTAAGRNAAMNFLQDTIPNGALVFVKNVYWHTLSSPNFFIDKWKADSVVNGPGRTLYHALYNMGFDKIDSFYKERVFIFSRKKNDPTSSIYQAVADSLSQKLTVIFDIAGSDLSGQYISTVIGPAKKWDAFKWKYYSRDTMGYTDTASVTIIGIDKNGNEQILFPAVKVDMPLDGISAEQYPNLKLIWNSKDSINLTSPQLAYWRVLYSPVPEAALNPSIHYAFNDTLSQGEMQSFSTAIENLTPLDMDSMLVRYRVIGADGVTRHLADKRYKPLKGNDTLHASLTFDPMSFPGRNLLYVEANPDDDQTEEYHPNNLGYVGFKVGVDSYNPLLDVTFDGRHILNGDIVSSRPFIKIRLKDENRFLALNDTSLLKVSIRNPSDSFGSLSHPIPFDGTRCRFIPATKSEPVNEAVIEYRPELTEDGTYQLTVNAVDKSGNAAGGVAGGSASTEYKILFEVDNKPSITNILNYPNPFSTSTAFVFTLTGYQIPSQLKIQILTVTGKVVREITRSELGPLHIGRNITEYKWDGRDQFGQLLGNGVYLYRVVTSLNGQDMELRSDSREMTRNGGGIDKYFKNGYGKMYIMR